MDHERTHDLPDDVLELQAMLLRTLEEVQLAKTEASTAKTEAATAKRAFAVQQQKVVELTTTVDVQKQQLDKNKVTITELLAALRGKTRERVDPDQLLLFEQGDLEAVIREQAASTDDQSSDDSTAEDKADDSSKKSRKKGHGRNIIPKNLVREEVLHELPEDQRLCPIDKQPMPLIRWETSEQLEYIPAQLKVLVHKRGVYACPQKHDEATLITAPKPPEPIEKGLAGPGLLAAMVIRKFGDHLPGYRLEDILLRHGADIRRSTIYGWLAQVADLLTSMHELMKQRVLSSSIIHTDDTKVKLVERGLRKTRTAHFWAYLGDKHNPYEVYDFTPTRERAGPEKFLENFKGYLQADAYSCHDEIYLKSNDAIIEVACWAHARRYWHKSREMDAGRAHHVLAIIGRLYEIERACRDSDAEFRLSQRQEHASPLLSDLKSWLDDQTFLPKSVIGQAATYTLNQWEALNRYLENGDLSIDNNAAERAMKPVAIGRKNWLFVGSELAGDRAAVLMSLIASCKRCEVEPWAWLKAVLEQVAERGADLGIRGSDLAPSSLSDLLPDDWLRSHPEHRWSIAERRRQERHKKGDL